MKRLVQSIIMFLSLASTMMTAAASTIMNGKEVTAHVGQIVMHNANTRQIEIKTEENSTGHWKLADHVVVLRGKERLSLSEIWGKTKRVRAWVAKSGEVERIDVLAWKE